MGTVKKKTSPSKKIERVAKEPKSVTGIATHKNELLYLMDDGSVMARHLETGTLRVVSKGLK